MCNNQKRFNEPIIKPFIGKYYNTPKSIFNTRLMVLGESHYDDKDKNLKERMPVNNSDDINFTCNVIKNYLNNDFKFDRWMNTFTKFSSSLINKKLCRNNNIKDISKIWNSVIFYNYIQMIMGSSRVAPSEDAIKNSEGSFYSVINQYKPELLIVWGIRLWDYLPHDFWTDGKIIKEGSSVSDYGFYTLNDGSKVFCTYVKHPSGGYSWSEVHKKISSYLSENRPKE